MARRPAREPARAAKPSRRGAARSPADTETVTCALCGLNGVPLHDLPPLGVVRCPQCSLVFTSPRLRPEALQTLYDDPGYFQGRVYGRGWSTTSLLQRAWTRGRLRTIADERRQPADGARLLEVGVGFGHFLASAREHGYDVTGVELSTVGAAHARDRLDLPVHTTHLAAAPLTAPFDVICAWDTLEHVPDPVAFLRTARDLLAEDGVLAFSTPYVSSLPARLLGARWWTLKPAEHLWHFTPATHAAVLDRAGLSLTRLIRSPLAAENLARPDSLVALARKRPTPPAG